jgi:hypothetical protein
VIALLLGGRGGHRIEALRVAEIMRDQGLNILTRELLKKRGQAPRENRT